jgi:putative spermidine/putrescine transport system permease protein
MHRLGKRPLALGLLLVPGIGYLALFFGAPLVWALLGSFQLDDGSFTTEWYGNIVTRNTMLRGLRASIYYGVAPVVLTLVASVILALLLRRSFLGRRLFNGLYKLPLAVPGIIVSLMVLVVAERGGFLDRLMMPFGLAMPKLVRDEWGIGVILASSWKQIPFMTLIIAGAYSAIPEDVSHAARSVGASRWQSFLFVETPLAMPGITAAILLTFISSMGSYDIPALIGPANPRPLSVLMVAEFNEGRFGQVFAMGMVLSAFAVMVLLAYYALTSHVGLRRDAKDT